MNSPQSTHASTAAASHTPGPWKAIKRGVGTDWLVIPADHEKRPDNWILAECRYQSNDEANARLIAAAPETAAERDRLREINAELLDALRTADGLLSRRMDNLTGDQAKALAVIRDAIAKATGHTE